MAKQRKLSTDQLTALGQALAHLMTTAENSIGPIHAKHAREAAGKLLWIVGIPEFKGENHRTTFYAMPPTKEIDGHNIDGNLLPAVLPRACHDCDGLLGSCHMNCGPSTKREDRNANS